MKLILTTSRVSVTHPRCFKPPSFWGVFLTETSKLLTSVREHHVFECFCGFQVLSKHVSESTNQQEWSHFPCEQYPKILDGLSKSTAPSTFITRVSPFWMISVASERPNLYESGVRRVFDSPQAFRTETDPFGMYSLYDGSSVRTPTVFRS